MALSWIGWWLHFSNLSVGNSLSWICWLLALFFLYCTVFTTSKRIYLKFPKRESIILFVAVTVMYVWAHAFVFSHAPWNVYGLFDDAAWDIYFANNHVFHAPFQAAYFDTVGYISREVVFHVQQALVYHMVMLSAFCVWLLVELALMPIQVLARWVAEYANDVNTALLGVVLAIYGLGALVGCVQTYRGQPFLYPAIGRRVLRGAARKSMMGD